MAAVVKMARRAQEQREPAIGRDAYIVQLVDLLFERLLEVVRLRQPEIEANLRGDRPLDELPPALLLRALQAYGIWFQLLAIAEENATIRTRRRIERDGGPDALPGTFSHVVAKAAAAGVEPAALQDLLDRSLIQPVLTAHPTEAKRVTVLEIHRRIYRLLVELESPRWTPRERAALVDDLRNEIDLLWLTGELRLEKPSVEQEVAWGLHFFDETIFGRIPELLDRLDAALARHYPETNFRIPPFFRFGSWIGGDRDGNPFVTAEVTRDALHSSRAAVLRRYHREIDRLMRTLSVAAHGVTVPPAFLARLATALDRSGRTRSHRGAQSRRGLPPVPRLHAAPARAGCAGRLRESRINSSPISSPSRTASSARAAPPSRAAWCVPCAGRSRPSASAPPAWTSARTPW